MCDAVDIFSISCIVLLFERLVAIGAIRKAATPLLLFLILLLVLTIAFVFNEDCDITGFTTIGFLLARPPLSNGDATTAFLPFSADAAGDAARVTVFAVGMFVVAVGTVFTSFTNGPGAKVVCAPFLLFRLSEL